MIRLGVHQALHVVKINPVHDLRCERALPSGIFLLVGIKGRYSGQALPIKNSPIVMGRDPSGCTLVFTSPTVSRRHCTVFHTRKGLVVQDLDSANGTYVNGKRIASRQNHPLRVGDILTLGKKDEQFKIGQ